MINGKERLKFTKDSTERGFKTLDFRDLYGQYCGFQQSSIATAECIWFGIHKVPISLNEPEGPTRLVVDGRMHLNRKQAKQLAEKLLKFSETGDL